MNNYEVIETLNMINQEKLDIRTITLGISLFDCIANDIDRTLDKIYDKICYTAKDLVKVADNLESQYGVPIINKRIAVTPISLIASSYHEKMYVRFAKTLQKSADMTGIDFIGGYTAICDKRMSSSDRKLIDSLPEVLSETEKVCASINCASTKSGINMDAVLLLGKTIKEIAQATKNKNSIGCAKLVVFANAPGDNPFMAGAFHGINEGDSVVNIGVSGPGVVKKALEKQKNADLTAVSECIKKTAFKITRAGQLIAYKASQELGIPFGIIDLSLAPTPTVGDSVARILEEMGLEVTGTHGTTAALMMLNDAVKKGGLMASSSVGGLSGSFIPVSEDLGMIEAVNKGALTLDKLEAMTSVCSVGLDMIVVPGDTESTTLSAIIADEMAIGVANNKTTAVRIIPAIGKVAGDNVDFGGLLGFSPVMDIHKFSSANFVSRGGRIPAPIHSLRN